MANQKLTPAEYLASERKAEFRSEYRDGEMVAMPRTNIWHSSTKTNLIGELGRLFDGGPCFTLSSTMRVKVPATNFYGYPDILVQCAEPELEDDAQNTLLNPRVIIEVLSDASESYDRFEKFRHYRHIESLQEYVLVAHNGPAAERYVRQPRWDWRLTTVAGLDAVLELLTVPAKVALAEIYGGVTFPDLPSPPAERPR